MNENSSFNSEAEYIDNVNIDIGGSPPSPPPPPPPPPPPKLKQSSKVSFGIKTNAEKKKEEKAQPKLSFAEELKKKQKNMGLNPENTSKKAQKAKKKEI